MIYIEIIALLKKQKAKICSVMLKLILKKIYIYKL